MTEAHASALAPEGNTGPRPLETLAAPARSWTTPVLFFLLAIAFAWACWIPMYFKERGLWHLPVHTLVLSTVGAAGPLVARIVLGLMGRAPRTGIISFSFPERGRRGWILPAILAFPLLAVLAPLLQHALGFRPSLEILSAAGLRFGWALLPVMAAHFAFGLFTSPLLEEPGWRGFALGELRARMPRWAASLLLGSLWYLWHQPMNITFGFEPSLRGWGNMVAQSAAADALYGLSGRRLLVAMLVHQSFAVSFVYFQRGGWTGLVLMACVAVGLHTLEARSRET